MPFVLPYAILFPSGAQVGRISFPGVLVSRVGGRKPVGVDARSSTQMSVSLFGSGSRSETNATRVPSGDTAACQPSPRPTASPGPVAGTSSIVQAPFGGRCEITRLRPSFDHDGQRW